MGLSSARQSGQRAILPGFTGSPGRIPHQKQVVFFSSDIQNPPLRIQRGNLSPGLNYDHTKTQLTQIPVELTAPLIRVRGLVRNLPLGLLFPRCGLMVFKPCTARSRPPCWGGTLGTLPTAYSLLVEGTSDLDHILYRRSTPSFSPQTRGITFTWRHDNKQ